jgi:2,4-dienoyl-CoA reductase-like NADH-dependent reductase (Old Yellow Enzyme family)
LEYRKLYQELASCGVGGIITGFAYISPEGKAMQPGQAGIETKEKIASFSPVTKEVHKYDCKIFMQLAHTGRQTTMEETEQEVWGVTSEKSAYFGGSPRELLTEQVYALVEQFAQAALYAQQAGFDGVQVHAAHGYLIHQFILPSQNKRTDEFGLDSKSGIGTKFLELVIDAIRKKCGASFALLVKISGSDDYKPSFTSAQFSSLLRFLDAKKVDGIEMSYGTMDNALNIFRGKIPLKTIMKHNPVFKMSSLNMNFFSKALLYGRMRLKLKPFTPVYNLEYAKTAKTLTNIPIICTGGIRTGEEMSRCLENDYLDFIGMSRPFICEPDLLEKLKLDSSYRAKCVNCNICAVMCDSGQPTQCYKR